VTSVIVVFPKIEDAKNIKNLLVRHGFSVSAVCNTGAAAINYADSMNSGIIVCGYKYRDMMYTELHECLPPQFEMLLVASRQLWEEYGERDIVSVAMPLKVHELINTLEMMIINMERKRRKQRLKPKVRSEEDTRLILKAKRMLMERNNMSEEEAHRYLQKTSMDSGTNLVETAQMIISIDRI